MSYFSRPVTTRVGDDYLNCPMDEPATTPSMTRLLAAEKVQPKESKDRPTSKVVFPIEVMANVATETMQFGPLKPVGLENPKTGERAYAVVQLRTETPIAPVTISWDSRLN